MEFKPDIAREIMMAVVECPTDIFDESITILGREFGDFEVSYHVRILGDQGYLEVKDISGAGPGYELFLPYRITGAGVDFVATFRDPSMWQRTKDTVMKHAPAPTLALLQAFGSASLKNLLNI